MSRPVNYKTKQSEAILSYIASLGDTHITVGEIVSHFIRSGTPIALTTVYRHLDRFVNSGRVRRYTIDGISGACFQYVPNDTDCKEHFHLKCEYCGELLHLQCDTLGEVKNHVLDKHDFEVNTMKTVLYGKCRRCLNDV